MKTIFDFYKMAAQLLHDYDNLCTTDEKIFYLYLYLRSAYESGREAAYARYLLDSEIADKFLDEEKDEKMNKEMQDCIDVYGWEAL